MRKLLVLALILYDVVAFGARMNNYDYDDLGIRDDKRYLRRKDHEDRRRHDYDNRYFDEMESKTFGEDHPRERDVNYRRYDDIDKLSMALSGSPPESEHLPFTDKEPDKKKSLVMNCDRPHERYEPCFAGCASVSCDNPRERLRPCYPFCEPGCVCVPPYVRDDRTHKCVQPDDCTKGLKGIPDLGEEA